MSALRVARGFTGRDKIVKFEGCYHGHSDPLLVKAGSGLATFGVPDSAGVPADIAASPFPAIFLDQLLPAPTARRCSVWWWALSEGFPASPCSSSFCIVTSRPAQIAKMLSLRQLGPLHCSTRPSSEKR